MKESSKHLRYLDATRKCAVLMLCKSIIAASQHGLNVNANFEQWSPGLEAAIGQSLRLEGSLLVSSTPTFPSSLEQPCGLVIDSARGPDVLLHFVDRVNETIPHQSPLGDASAAALREFVPESLSSIKNGSKSTPLSLRTSAQSSLSHVDAEACSVQPKRLPHLSQKTGLGAGRAHCPIDASGTMHKIEFASSGYSTPSICTLDEVLEIIDQKIDASGYTSEEGIDFTQLSVGIEGMTF